MIFLPSRLPVNLSEANQATTRVSGPRVGRLTSPPSCGTIGRVPPWILRAWFVGIGAALLAIAACGARTGLPAPDVDAGPADAGPDVIDAARPKDAGPDVVDAAPDVEVEDCA